MKQFLLICGLFLLATLHSCKRDFIVEDIDDKSLTVNAPANNLVTTANLVTFWWEPLDGAEKYTLQIVKPNFAAISQLLVDTNVTGNKFNYTLQPGSYQWRIKATNAGHATAFQIYNLKIDTTSDLSAQVVNLFGPANGFVTGSKVVTFNWNAIQAAKKYRFIINNGVVKDSITTLSSLTWTLPAASNATTAYTWNVKAINDFSESNYNPTAFTLTVDLKPPSAPGLSSPTHWAMIKDTTKLVWVRNGSDVVYDSIYVADDSLFTNVITQVWNDQRRLTISELGLNLSPPGTYYWWRARSFDEVGNRSSFSGRLKFKLIP